MSAPIAARWFSSALIIVILSSILGACVTTPKVGPSAATRAPTELRDWEARGRLAVSAANEGGSGSFIWSQRDHDARIQLRGPVGVGSLRLTISNDLLTVETGGKKFRADDAEAELTDRLGAPVPTQDLRYWLLGIPAPGPNEWSNSGATATLNQHEWRIDYQRFDVISGVRLPMKLVASSGAAKVRIVIDKWNLK